MQDLLYLREEYGECFVTELPNGQVVPWQLLTVSEYLKFDRLAKSGQYPHPVIENEIFKAAVLDAAFVKNIDTQLAGTIKTVAEDIMFFSGPNSTEDLQQALEYSRHQANSVLNELMTSILLAFPAYTPEDVENMDYETVMIRFAMAETKLLAQNFIQEPFSFGDTKAETPVVQDDNDGMKSQIERRELLDDFYAGQGINVPDSIKEKRAAMRDGIVEPERKPPIPDMKRMEQVPITAADVAEHEVFLTGHDQDHTNKVKSTQETAKVYDDYLDQMAKDGKLTIKSPEERIRIAKERSEKNRLKNEENIKRVQAEEQAELPKLLQAREAARKRKERRSRKKK